MRFRLCLLAALLAPVLSEAQSLSDFSNFTPNAYGGSWSSATAASGATRFAIGNFGSGSPQNDGSFFVSLGGTEDWSSFSTIYLSGFAGAEGAQSANAATTLNFYVEDVNGNIGTSAFPLSIFSASEVSEQSVALNFGLADSTQIAIWGFTTGAVPTANFAFTFDRVGFSAVPEPGNLPVAALLVAFAMARCRRRVRAARGRPC
jgi:hypothetical protein